MSVTFKPKYWMVEAVLIMAKTSIKGALGTEGTPPRQLGKSFVNGSGSVVGRIVLVLPLLLQLGLDDGWILAAAQVAHDARPVDFRLGEAAVGRSMVGRRPGCRGIGWLGKQVELESKVRRLAYLIRELHRSDLGRRVIFLVAEIGNT